MSPGIVAESDLSGALKSEYVFFDGERVARKDFPGGAVSYYFSDHLKTASVVTDSAGNIKEDEDFYPWGGELQFVNNDSNHYKFGGHERDNETGLDYMLARYYSNPLGRFLTPDWAAKPAAVPYAVLDDPQSLNLYTYVRNISTSKTDPDGHFQDPCTCPRNPWAPWMPTPQEVAAARAAPGTAASNGAVAVSSSPGSGLSNIPPPPIITVSLQENGNGGTGSGSNANSQGQSTPADPNKGQDQKQQDEKGTQRTEHGQERADQARAGDAHREVGDANRIIREGKQYTDSETGNQVSVRGNRVVIRDQDGNIVSQFKNTKANTNQRVQDGRWVRKPEPEEQK